MMYHVLLSWLLLLLCLSYATNTASLFFFNFSWPRYAREWVGLAAECGVLGGELKVEWEHVECVCFMVWVNLVNSFIKSSQDCVHKANEYMKRKMLIKKKKILNWYTGRLFYTEALVFSIFYRLFFFFFFFKFYLR